MAESEPIQFNIVDEQARDFYSRALEALRSGPAPFLLGGAFAFATYTEIERHTKDLDIFVCESDLQAVLVTLRSAGFQTELAYPHWLAKAWSGEHFIDVIFRSGNGMAPVDKEWFEHAAAGAVLEIPVLICPPEETIWSKAFVQERERFDGADVAHLLRGCAERIDWRRLLHRFGEHWRVLLSHLVLFGFIYPAHRGRIPAWVMEDLTGRLTAEMAAPTPTERVCHGTLLSRQQYLVDIERWGYADGRLQPWGPLTSEQIVRWTAAIEH